jgi:hypothetical protein
VDEHFQVPHSILQITYLSLGFLFYGPLALVFFLLSGQPAFSIKSKR